MAPRIAIARGAVRQWRRPPFPLPRALPLRFVSGVAGGMTATGTQPQTAPPRREPNKWRRFPKYLADSPNATLALRLKSRTEPLTFAAWQRFEAVARSRSLRLPVVALQMLLRQDEARVRTSLSQSLCSDAEWRARLNSLAYKGIGEADIRHWVWILAARDADERIARFVGGGVEGSGGGDRPKPLFLLFQLLRRDETFRKGSSLAALYHYILRHHVQTRGARGGSRDGAGEPPPFGAVRRTLDPGLNMTPDAFATTLRLLVHHYRRLWPSALPAVARLASAYVETLLQRAQAQAQAQAYADACKLFNLGLTLFQGKAAVQPVASMRYNWRAQKVLLGMSASAETRPLLISRDGFRAIRRVLLALGKSADEQRVALRMARTWPPYRRVLDGLDEQRQPADELSRSVRAGVLMREAGYGETEHDRALSVLGGVQTPGAAPTVQTRSLSPRTWTGRQASLNVFSTWAARVKATRDVNEAWHEFQQAPPPPGGGGGEPVVLRPNAQVYAELFKKLLAAPVDVPLLLSGQAAAVLPGDGREVFAVNDAALTAFEKQRLRPPDVAAVYAQMLGDGCRPVGDCLVTLVQHAPSVAAGLQYLRDSPLDRQAVEAMRVPAGPGAPPRPPPDTDTLRGIPLAVLNAYVHLLCRFQPRRTAEPARLGKLQRTALVHHAIHLCALRLPATHPASRAYKAPWHTIVRTLARPRLLVRAALHTADADADADADQQYQDTEALALALRVFGQVQQAAGVDVVLFDSLAKATLKVLQWGDLAESTTTATTTTGTSPAEVLRQAHAALTAAFDEMTNQAAAAVAAAAHHPATPHSITAGSLEAYLAVLGYAGDRAGLVAALRWVLSVWDDDAVLEDAKDPAHRQHAAMGRVFALVRAFTEGVDAVDAVDVAADLASLQQQLQQLQQQRGCTWRWATPEDADAYVQWHRQAHNAAFWDRVRPGVDAA